MSKLDDFDLDITMKKSTKKGVEPATGPANNTIGTFVCITGQLWCRKQSK